jgi:hypothetical protein
MAELTGKQVGLTAVRGRMLLPKEVALFLRVSERLIQSLMQNGMFPIRWYPISPRCRLVDSEDLNDYLERIRAEPGAYVLPPKAIRQIQKEEVTPM